MLKLKFVVKAVGCNIYYGNIYDYYALFTIYGLDNNIKN